jgi:hypothetical protein
VTGHHFTDALPEAGIPVDHALDVFDGVAVVAVKTTDDGVDAPLFVGGKRLDLPGDEHIGGGVPIDARIVGQVILGLAVFGLSPDFDDGHAADDSVFDAAFVHGGHGGFDAVGVLEEVDQMQMAVGHAVPHAGRQRLKRGRRRGG